MKKKSSTIVALSIALSLAITVVLPASPFMVDAQASVKTKALKAYAKVLKEEYIQWDDGVSNLKDSRFGLAYVDKDNVVAANLI